MAVSAPPTTQDMALGSADAALTGPAWSLACTERRAVDAMRHLVDSLVVGGEPDCLVHYIEAGAYTHRHSSFHLSSVTAHVQEWETGSFPIALHWCCLDMHPTCSALRTPEPSGTCLKGTCFSSPLPRVSQ